MWTSIITTVIGAISGIFSMASTLSSTIVAWWRERNLIKQGVQQQQHADLQGQLDDIRIVKKVEDDALRDLNVTDAERMSVDKFTRPD